MSKVLTSKFGFPIRTRRRRSRVEDVHPDFGIHTGLAPNKLPKGFSPSLQNLVNKDDGRVGMRDGLAGFGDYNFGGPVLGAAELYDNFGNLCGFAPSATSFAYLHPEVQEWSELSYVPGSVVTTTQTGLPSGLSTDYYSTTVIYEPSNASMIAVTSNSTDWAKFFFVHSDTTIYSDFTWIDSLVSTKAAESVVAFDDRLVFFNTLSSNESRFPTRVLWSARGLPLNYQIADGAGFEDLKDMRGYGQTAIHHKELLYLFTDQEIWRGIPTRDAYAFRFERVTDERGCIFPNSIADGPQGIVFLGKDYEVYLTNGVEFRALGPVDSVGPSRIQRLLRDEVNEEEKNRIWGIYNQTHNRYELYYPTTTSTDGFPNAALFYSFEDTTWWKQKFSHSLSDGIDLEDYATLTTWDELSVTWDSLGEAWDSFNQSTGGRSVNVFDSAGSTYRFRSTKTLDDSDVIDVRWRSPGLNQQDQNVRQNVKELFVDYEAESNSSVSFFFSEDLGKTFDSGTEVAFTEDSTNVFVPVWSQARHPMFELRNSDGQMPSFFRIEATLSSAGKF